MSDVEVCQAVVKSCSTDRVKPTNSEESTSTTTNPTGTSSVSYHSKNNSVAITSNDISILCNQSMTEPGNGSDGRHDFAMIYMSMSSSETDVEAIYLRSRSEEA